MHLTQPQWLWLLALPGVLAVYHLFSPRRATVRWSNQAALKSVMVGGKGILRHVAAGLLLLVMATASLVAARPAFASSHNEPRSAVIFVVDVSASMSATDIAPSRIAAAKGGVEEAVSKAPPDLNIGLVTVDGEAHQVFEPSLSRDELLVTIRSLTAEDLPGTGTASGDGVIEAVELLDAVSTFGSTEALPARIVLVSDGREEVPEGRRTLVDAAEKAKESGYPVFTVDYGTDNGTLNGQPIKRDPKELNAIATATGGSFYSAGSQAELADVLSSIPGSIVEEHTEAVFPLWTFWAALAVLAATAVSFLVFTRR